MVDQRYAGSMSIEESMVWTIGFKWARRDDYKGCGEFRLASGFIGLLNFETQSHVFIQQDVGTFVGCDSRIIP